MGQATVDLPDPMKSPAAPATAGTDDLLAQLAGDEIERLLAETETERPVSAAASALTNSELPTTAFMPPAAPSKIESIAAPSPADISANKENLTDELDALFESINEGATPPPPAASVAIAPSASVAMAPAPVEHAAPEVQPQITAPSPATTDIASSSAELKALGEPIAAVRTPASEASARPIARAHGEARPSFLVRLLATLNKPMGPSSDPVRDTVGKIAIATLLNAIAVLAYTLVFRHR